MKKYKGLLAVLALAAGLALQAQTNELVIQAGKPGAEIQPTMYGLFFEDINYAADGGLYAELVKNRSFEFPQHFMGWKTFGKVSLKDDGPFERNPHYVRLAYAGHPHKQTGLDNEGFFGIGIKKGAEYRFSVWARVAEGETPAKIRVELADTKSMGEQQAFATADVTVDSREWKKYQVILKPEVTNPKAILRIFLASRQTVDLEHISLFPVDTWQGHENGLRKDLAQALADIKPGVFRFPGGCIVEGTDIASRYDWKKSVGMVENRPLNENRWQYTFPHRFFPDYYQSYGLGFYEFFQLSEEIGAEPLPVLSCGLACQFQNPNMDAHVPLCDLDSYIQDALDLIEFANGAVDTPWGKVRADMGHPAPFNLKFIGIGNEQWGKEYPEHLEPFVKAIRKKYPDIKIVGSSGPDSEGKDFEYLWPEMKRLKVDLVDEHFYRSPEWFLNSAKRYDSYDRQGPKVFAGEYACHPTNRENSFLTALCEAAFMTGLERNADVVELCTYAPLFAHVDAWQWRPDLIWFNNLNIVKTPNYYVQQLYGHNAGTNVLPLTMNKEAVTGQSELFATAALDKGTNELIIKIVIQSKKIQLNLNGISSGKHKGKLMVLHASDLEAKNTLGKPETVIPIESAVELEAPATEVSVQPLSFLVYRISL